MTLPTAPTRTMDQDTFDTTADAFIGALPQFETDMNALAAAMSLNSTTDTSASSVAIGTGSKTFTISAGKSFWPGMWLVIADTAAPTTNGMFCQVTSYSGTTLVVTSHSIQGSGTIASWQISQSAPAFNGTINGTRGSIAMHATTMDIWAQPNIIDGTGSPVTITAITNAPQAGAWRLLYPIVGSVLTNGVTFDIDGGGNATAETGDGWLIESVTTSTYKVHVIKANKASDSQFNLSAVTDTNALVITLKAGEWLFRNSTLGTGEFTKVGTGNDLTLTVSSGSTLGTINGVESDILVRVINDAGTLRLSAENLSGGMDASETGVISTTAEGGAGGADSATVIYSGTAVTSKAYRVAGIIRSTQATAGTWVTAPSLIQGAGGNALTAMHGLGYGQTRQSLTIASGTTYYNPTAKPIEIALQFNITAANPNLTINVGGFNIFPSALMNWPNSGYAVPLMTFTVKPRESYTVTYTNSTLTASGIL